MTPGKGNSLNIKTRKEEGVGKRRDLLHRSDKTFRTFDKGMSWYVLDLFTPNVNSSLEKGR